MKNILVLICFTLSVTLTSAQKTYLEIYRSNDFSDVIMYPPGTPYQLYDDESNLIVSDVNFEGTFKILGNYTLKVFPSWKSEPEIFKLSMGEIRATSTKKYGQGDKTTYKKFTSNGVTVEKFLSDSEKFPGKLNMTLKFSNGILFKYTDGEAQATLDGEELKIESKYLVYSKLGVAKISFNPDNGVAWWVFEPHRR